MKLHTALLACAIPILALAGCSKQSDKAVDTPAAGPATPAAAPAAPAASTPASTDAAADNYPKVDPASLTDASSVADVHNALVRPGYKRLTDAENTAPTTDAGWKDVADGITMINKGMDLLQTGARPKDKGDWITFAKAVKDKTKGSADLVAQKKGDDLVLADGDIQDACTSCHKKYRQ